VFVVVQALLPLESVSTRISVLCDNKECTLKVQTRQKIVDSGKKAPRSSSVKCQISEVEGDSCARLEAAARIKPRDPKFHLSKRRNCLITSSPPSMLPTLVTKPTPARILPYRLTQVALSYTTTGRRSFGRMVSKASLKRAEDFTEFLNASPTPFHAVQSAKLRLEKAGFKQIKVCDCGKYIAMVC